MTFLDLFSGADGLWGESKTSIEMFVDHSLGFSHDALHVLAGPGLQLLAAALMRKSIRSAGPLLFVFLLELANEWHDLRVEEWPSPAMQWGEGAKDLILTMALPTLLLILARYAPSLFCAPKGHDDKTA